MDDPEDLSRMDGDGKRPGIGAGLGIFGENKAVTQIHGHLALYRRLENDGLAGIKLKGTGQPLDPDLFKGP